VGQALTAAVANASKSRFAMLEKRRRADSLSSLL
jgi:hypothetical protein